MNVNDEAKVDRIFAEADIVVLDSSPELLGAARPSTIDAEEVPGKNPPPSISHVVSVCHSHTRR